jgi:phospholipase/carboxylesterase
VARARTTPWALPVGDAGVLHHPGMADARTPSLSLVTRIRRPAVETDRPPVLFLFHGVGSNELSMAGLAPDLDPRLLVVSVRSPIELGPFSFGWYPVEFTWDGPRIDADAALAGWERAGAFVDEAVGTLGADPDRVFVAGFSQGGIIALALLLTSPERVAGAVCMSGRLPAELLPHAVAPERLRGKPVLIVHGTGDRTLPVAYARSARDTLTGLPVQLTYREIEIGHTTSPESVAIVSGWIAERLAPGS